MTFRRDAVLNFCRCKEHFKDSRNYQSESLSLAGRAGSGRYIMPADENVIRTGKHSFEQLLTLKEAADLLGIHWKTLESQARRGQIPATKIGKRWRFRTSVLNDWVAARFTPANVESASSLNVKLAAQPRRAS